MKKISFVNIVERKYKMPPDWIDYCVEEKHINYDSYYEAMAEKEDLEMEDI